MTDGQSIRAIDCGFDSRRHETMIVTLSAGVGTVLYDGKNGDHGRVTGSDEKIAKTLKAAGYRVRFKPADYRNRESAVKSKDAKPEAKTEAPSEADIKWAKKHGWEWNGEEFNPAPAVRVIRNPMSHERPGWTPWLPAIGALQIDAPFGNVRAALRVAEEIRRQRPLGDNEMSCAEEV